MNVLITGSNGYIGGRLANYLSRFETNKLFLSSRKNISFYNKKIKSRKINWNNTNDILNSCSNMDVVIHLAGMNAQTCLKYPDEAKIFNVQNTMNLFESATRYNIKKFIFLSSIHVYGDNLVSKINEDCLKKPVGPYAHTKSLAEDKLLKLNEKSKLDLFLLRLSNVFGPPRNNLSECWSLVFNDFTNQAMRTGNILVKSNGTQMRDFMTMTDFCRSINHIISTFDSSIKYNIFNIGGNKTLKISDVANIIKSRSKRFLKNVKINYASSASNNNEIVLDYDISRFFSTDFKLKKDFTEELDELLQYVKNNL